MKKVLVTGGAGFIGFHLCKRLLKEGLSVCSVDNLNDYYDVKLKEDRIHKLKYESEKNGFDLIIGKPSLSNTSSTTDAVFVLKGIPIPVGGSLVWDDDNVLSNIFVNKSYFSIKSRYNFAYKPV